MIKTEIKIVEKIPKLKAPILIEGLPGIGFVGKLAAEYMVEQLKAKKVAELYSHHFPHQVLLDEGGTLRMLKNEIFVLRTPKVDLVFLIGDIQPITPEAQHEVCGEALKFFKKLGGKTIITLGGYSTGKVLEAPRVLGAATSKKLIEEYKKYGVEFGVAGGSIVGAAGLLLGLGQMFGMEGICLMGETHGAYVDHKAAQKVLEVLSKALGVPIDTTKIAQKAKESEEVIRRIEEARRKAERPVVPTPERPTEITYIR